MDFLTIGGVFVPVPEDGAEEMDPIGRGGDIQRALNGTPVTTTEPGIRRWNITTARMTKTQFDAIEGAYEIGVPVEIDGRIVEGVPTMAYVRRDHKRWGWKGLDLWYFARYYIEAVN